MHYLNDATLTAAGHALSTILQINRLAFLWFGVLVGLVLMWIAAKSSPTLFRAAAYPMVGVSVLGLMLVLAVGKDIQGGERWISLMGFQIQPSEFAKLAFVLWGADLLARKEKNGQLTEWRHLLIPLLPGAAIFSMLVMLCPMLPNAAPSTKNPIAQPIMAPRCSRSASENGPRNRVVDAGPGRSGSSPAPKSRRPDSV